MKKLLGIVVLGLMLSNNVEAEKKVKFKNILKEDLKEGMKYHPPETNFYHAEKK